MRSARFAWRPPRAVTIHEEKRMTQSNSHGGNHSSHPAHTTTSEAGQERKHAAATEHKAVRTARKVDSKIY